MALEAQEIAAGLKPQKLGEVVPKWEELGKSAAGTPWEAKIQRRVRICKLLIETPSTIQKRSSW